MPGQSRGRGEASEEMFVAGRGRRRRNSPSRIARASSRLPPRELRAGDVAGVAPTTIVRNKEGFLDQQSIAMQVTQTLDDRSNEVSVECGSLGDDMASADRISITGLKVGRLSNVDVD